MNTTEAQMINKMIRCKAESEPIEVEYDSKLYPPYLVAMEISRRLVEVTIFAREILVLMKEIPSTYNEHADINLNELINFSGKLVFSRNAVEWNAGLMKVLAMPFWGDLSWPNAKPRELRNHYARLYALATALNYMVTAGAFYFQISTDQPI